jgi:hypothetical protein
MGEMNVTGLLTCALLRGLRTAWLNPILRRSVVVPALSGQFGPEANSRNAAPKGSIKAARFLTISLVQSYSFRPGDENASQSGEGWRPATTVNPCFRGRGGCVSVFQTNEGPRRNRTWYYTQTDELWCRRDGNAPQVTRQSHTRLRFSGVIIVISFRTV